MPINLTNMKKGILVSIFMALAFMGMAQVSENSTYEVINNNSLGLMTQADTLSTSTSLDTSLWNVSKMISQTGEFEYVCRADSISGSTAATGYLETSMTGGASDDEWQIYSTFTINGAGTTEYKISGTLIGKYVRDRIYAPSGTQSTRLIRTLKWRKG